MIDTYDMGYKCRNCYHVCLVQIQKGKEAPTYFTCPACATSQLYKADWRKVSSEWIGGVYVLDGDGIRQKNG